MGLRFKPLLADRKTPDTSLLRYPVLASPKLDGIRCVIGEDGVPVSRTIKPIRNNYTRAKLQELQLPPLLDGELIVGSPTAHNCMQATSSGIMSIDGEPDFSYHIFDYAIRTSLSFSVRLEMAVKIAERYSSFINIVPHTIIYKEDELLVYENNIVTMGYEGVMIRDPYGRYKYGRSTLSEGILLKLKRFIDEEAEIIGFVEKMHNANTASKDNLGHTKRSTHQDNLIPMDTLGAFIVRSDRWGEFNVGVGQNLGDDLRKYIWDNRPKFLHKIITFKYQLVGSKDKPRLPIFKWFREAE